MINLWDRHVAASGKTLPLLGDAAFTAPVVLGQLPASTPVTGRVAANVRLYDPPAPRPPGKRGRNRIRGERLPTPRQMREVNGLDRLTIKLYEASTYQLRVATPVGRFHKAPDREVLIIAVEHLRGGRGIEVFDTTDLEADIETVLQRYSWRWSLEVTFHDTKTHRGITEPQNRTPLATRRTAAMGFLLDSLIVWRHDTARDEPARPLRGGSGKRSASFADRLAALRLETLEKQRETNFSTPSIPPRVKKFLDQLTTLVSLAT